MNRETLSTLGVSAALLAVAMAAWAFELRAPLTVDPRSLAQLPGTLGDWTATDLPVDATVERILRADFHVQRAYTHPAGGVIWAYVGYYGTERGGRSAHTPQVCYPADGWTVLEDRGGIPALLPGARVNELVVARGAERRLVHHWYRSYRSTGLLSELDHQFDRLVGRLFDGRADGAFMRLSTPLGSRDEHAARAVLATFAAEFDAQVGRHWPTEHPAPQS